MTKGVLVAEAFLLQRLLALAIVLPDAGFGMAAGMVLWGFGVVYQVLRVALQYLYIVVPILGGAFP